MSRSEARCIAPDRGAAQRPPGDPVADPGDLALVGHQRRPARCPGRLVDLARHPRAPAPGCAPASASARSAPACPPSGHQPTSRSRQTRTCAGAAADRRLDQVEVRRAVDHQHRRAARDRAAAELDQLARAPRGRRSGRRRRCPRSPARRATAPRAAVKARTPAEARVELEDRGAARAAERTDFEATRIGLPAGLGEHRPRRWRRIASRSTKANGGVDRRRRSPRSARAAPRGRLSARWRGSRSRSRGRAYRVPTAAADALESGPSPERWPSG